MLLVRPQDAMRDQWEGATVNPEAAVGAFGMDAAHALGTDAAAAAVEELLGRGAAGEAEEAGEVTAVCVPSVDGFYDPRVVADGLRDLLCMNVERGGEEEEGVLVDGEDETLTEDEDESAGVAARPVRPVRDVRDVRDVLDQQRVVKSEAELAIMRRAARSIGLAFEAAMGATRAGMGEGEIEAHLDFAMRLGGAQRSAFPSVVAGGVNGVTLHYVSNDHILRSGDLLLVDAGAEVDGCVTSRGVCVCVCVCECVRVCVRSCIVWRLCLMCVHASCEPQPQLCNVYVCILCVPSLRVPRGTNICVMCICVNCVVVLQGNAFN